MAEEATKTILVELVTRGIVDLAAGTFRDEVWRWWSDGTVTVAERMSRIGSGYMPTEMIGRATSRHPKPDDPMFWQPNEGKE